LLDYYSLGLVHYGTPHIRDVPTCHAGAPRSMHQVRLRSNVHSRVKRRDDSAHFVLFEQLDQSVGIGVVSGQYASTTGLSKLRVLLKNDLEIVLQVQITDTYFTCEDYYLVVSSSHQGIDDGASKAGRTTCDCNDGRHGVKI
jgi:hypothetical protein